MHLPCPTPTRGYIGLRGLRCARSPEYRHTRAVVKHRPAPVFPPRGDDCATQSVGHRDDRVDDDPYLLGRGHLVDQRPMNLQVVSRDAAKRCQTRVTGTESVKDRCEIPYGARPTSPAQQPRPARVSHRPRSIFDRVAPTGRVHPGNGQGKPGSSNRLRETLMCTRVFTPCSCQPATSRTTTPRT